MTRYVHALLIFILCTSLAFFLKAFLPSLRPSDRLRQWYPRHLLHQSAKFLHLDHSCFDGDGINLNESNARLSHNHTPLTSTTCTHPLLILRSSRLPISLLVDKSCLSYFPSVFAFSLVIQSRRTFMFWEKTVLVSMGVLKLCLSSCQEVHFVPVLLLF